MCVDAFVSVCVSVSLFRVYILLLSVMVHACGGRMLSVTNLNAGDDL